VTKSTLTVAVPPEVADATLQRAPSGISVLSWAGTGSPPADDVDVWVPPYGLGLSADQAAAGLRSLPGLRLVQLLSAGVEPWPGLVPSGVTLCSGRGIHGGSTAELAVALTLAWLRELPRYAEQQRRHEWRRHEPSSMAGRRVLVLGAGDIGTRVAEVFRLLEATVTVAARRSRDGVVALSDAREHVGEVDVLVVAVPLTQETHHLVDAELLGRLPDGALVVNVARGAVADTDALTGEVTSGRLFTALDVTDPEPLPPDHPLWATSNAVVTPHVGGGAAGWEDRAVALVVDQLRRLESGEPLRNVVDAGY
jgi:phosphoglycerate dehydrogenase-like enzyme